MNDAPRRWQEQARCRGLDPETFFPERGDFAGIARAKAVCEQCPVTAECLNYALQLNERDGVFGNTSANQRRKLRGNLVDCDREMTCMHCGRQFLGHARAKLCSEDCRNQRARLAEQRFRTKGAA